MTTLGRVAFIAVVPVLLVWALLAAELATSHRAPRASASVSSSVSVQDDSPAATPGTVGPREDERALADQTGTDFYGNEVSDAVAEYGLDASGSLYEMHAPQVELPHLGSPKS